jgi:hypothetical protein
MNEGWCDNNYLVLFTEEESGDKTRQYKLAEYLPGFRLIGLKGWDDFIVIDQAGNLFSVPTIPMLREQMESFNLSLRVSFTTDDRFQGKIKWYTKPIIFGGARIRVRTSRGWIISSTSNSSTGGMSCTALSRKAAMPNPSIEGTSTSKLRLLAAAPHVKR